MKVQDSENLSKASQTASFLVGDLKALTTSENPFLAEIATDLLTSTVALELRLNRLVALASNGNSSR